jgi:hypothetical protein
MDVSLTIVSRQEIRQALRGYALRDHGTPSPDIELDTHLIGDHRASGLTAVDLARPSSKGRGIGHESVKARTFDRYSRGLNIKDDGINTNYYFLFDTLDSLMHQPIHLNPQIFDLAVHQSVPDPAQRVFDLVLLAIEHAVMFDRLCAVGLRCRGHVARNTGERDTRCNGAQSSSCKLWLR